MFINQDIVATIFRHINFLALLGIFFYCFKKYILPDTELLIAQKEADKNLLFLQQTTLEKQQHILDNLFREEALQCEQLKTKIDEWNRTVMHENELCACEYQNAHEILVQRILQRTQRIEQNRIEKYLVNATVNRIEHSLSQHFATEKFQQQYFNNILEFLHKGVE